MAGPYPVACKQTTGIYLFIYSNKFTKNYVVETSELIKIELRKFHMMRGQNFLIFFFVILFEG